MSKIQYMKKRFSGASLEMVDNANEIIDEYALKGFDLTLRQLYYQFVSRDLLANNQREYKRLGDVINDARLAGLVDWSAIVDRTRNLRSIAHWDGPADIVRACSQQFHLDKWADQRVRVEVWIEKDALTGVIEGVCRDNDVPFFSCRGYTSQSEMWAASQRMVERAQDNNQKTLVLHLGDHDPSGIDMSRDIEERLHMFIQRHTDPVPPQHWCQVMRIALNMPQIEEYEPPPNPAKLSDSRAESYVSIHGDESWELDALSPEVLTELIQNEIDEVRDKKAWKQVEKEQAAARARLAEVAEELAAE